MYAFIVRDVKGYHAYNCGKGIALLVGIDSESGETGLCKGKIVVAAFQITVYRSSRQLVDLAYQDLCIRWEQSLCADAVDMTVKLFAYRTSGNDEKIGCSVVYGLFKIFV